MIRLLFVGDGERDAATNPRLVATITGAGISPTAIPWPRLHRAGHGFDRKLLFAIRKARQDGLQGVVATIDQDKSPGRDRLRDLEAGRIESGTASRLRPSRPLWAAPIHMQKPGFSTTRWPFAKPSGSTPRQ